MFEEGCIHEKEKEELFLIYEGEYINGKRNGKGKEYNLEGKIIFEGEYLNRKRNGKGKEYYYNGSLKFEVNIYNKNNKVKNKPRRSERIRHHDDDFKKDDFGF